MNIMIIGENEYEYKNYTITGNEKIGFVCIAPYGKFFHTVCATLTQAIQAIEEDLNYIRNSR